MAQLQRNEWPNGKMPANIQPNDRPVNQEISQQRRELVTELGTISALIEQNVRDLSQPMTVILGLNDLMFPKIEPSSNLAADLVAVTKQIKRMSQIVSEVNDLVEQRKKLLNLLGTLHLSSARHEAGLTGTYSMREE
jgi:signal transduction histidine kinase